MSPLRLLSLKKRGEIGSVPAAGGPVCEVSTGAAWCPFLLLRLCLWVRQGGVRWGCVRWGCDGKHRRVVLCVGRGEILGFESQLGIKDTALGAKFQEMDGFECDFHSRHCRKVGAHSWRRCTVVAGSPGYTEAPCWDPPRLGLIFQGRGWNIWEADRLGRSASMPPSPSAPPCSGGTPCRSWCRRGWRGPRPGCPGRCWKRRRRLRLMEAQAHAACTAPALMSGALIQQMFISVAVTQDALLQPWYRSLLL